MHKLLLVENGEGIAGFVLIFPSGAEGTRSDRCSSSSRDQSDDCTHTNGETPLLLSLANQEGDFLLHCLKILLEGNRSRHEGNTPKKIDMSSAASARIASLVLYWKDNNMN